MHVAVYIPAVASTWEAARAPAGRGVRVSYRTRAALRALTRETRARGGRLRPGVGSASEDPRSLKPLTAFGYGAAIPPSVIGISIASGICVTLITVSLKICVPYYIQTTVYIFVRQNVPVRIHRHP